MKRDVRLFIGDILESITNIESFLKDISKESFLNNKLIQSAVVRELEVIGEATKNIPNSFREKYDEVSWRKIASTRDKIIHGYFGVNYEVVWEIIKKDLPMLKKQMRKIKKDLNEL
jgi:uncharacterized protein with HEPN domain